MEATDPDFIDEIMISSQLSKTIADLLATLLNAETQLQARLHSCDHPGLSAWGRKVLAHTLQSSEHISASLITLADNLGVVPGVGRVAYSVEPFLRRITIQADSTQHPIDIKPMEDFESAAALLRCTKLRVADLALLRLALGVTGNQTARQDVNQLLEDAYLSAERLREFASQPLRTDGIVLADASSPTCRTCRHWAGNSDADEPTKAACMHPSLEGVRLQVSARSDCGRHEGTTLLADRPS